jgi:predicted dehydrogenase
MAVDRPIRWGILGTAGIARDSFLPGLRATEEGIAYAVAGRDLARAERFAAENGVEHAVEGYAALLADPRIDAVYIPLPNSLHAEWTIAALRAGKSVLCEKPLTTSVEQTEEVLAVARETGLPLWEAFVFPFHEQMARLREIMASGEIGEIREVQSNFHFLLTNPNDIRLSPHLAGGALNDVGCYCIRLAQFVFESDPDQGEALARWTPEGVDGEMQGVLNYPGERRLLFSCGLSRPRDTFSRVIGSAGEVRFSDPFHPTVEDHLELRLPQRPIVERAAGPRPSFTPALRHIQATLRGEGDPRHLAVQDAMSTALGLGLARRSARSAALETTVKETA